MPLGAVSICQVSNQLSGKLVNVHASEVIELLSLEIEDGRAKDDRYLDTTAVEYFSVHDLPPIGGPAASACASGSRATAPTTGSLGRSHGFKLSVSAAISSSVAFSAATNSWAKPRRKSRSAVSISPATKSSGTPSIGAS